LREKNRPLIDSSPKELHAGEKAVFLKKTGIDAFRDASVVEGPERRRRINLRLLKRKKKKGDFSKFSCRRKKKVARERKKKRRAAERGHRRKKKESPFPRLHVRKGALSSPARKGECHGKGTFVAPPRKKRENNILSAMKAKGRSIGTPRSEKEEFRKGKKNCLFRGVPDRG